MPEMQRRTFLALSGLAVAGIATACGGKGDGIEPNKLSLDQVIQGSKDRKLGEFTMIQALGEVLVSPDARVTFALLDKAGTTRLKGGTIRVFAAMDRSSPAHGPVNASYHDEGLGEKGVYVVRLKLDKPGNWDVLAVGKPEGASGQLYGGATFPVVAQVSGPAPGGPALSVSTPTVDNHRGVEPYCTRVDAQAKPAPCAMHTISLDAALQNGKPTVFNIGTPKFCQSQVCGPVVDVIQSVSTEFTDRVNFIHAEVYKDDKDAPAKGLLAPAPAAYKLTEEPITYWIRPDGTITERLVGPVDIPEVRDLTNALL
ncbi:MAG: hypothetical protein ACRDKS_01610 [Actinomycetota bacterium]